jgi:hypothetical protein
MPGSKSLRKFKRNVPAPTTQARPQILEMRSEEAPAAIARAPHARLLAFSLMATSALLRAKPELKQRQNETHGHPALHVHMEN